MKFICLQAGHENTQNNADLALRNATGAPGEVQFTEITRNRLSEILLSKKMPDGSPAFQIQLVDANFNSNPDNQKDFDLFLAIHYDADVYKDPRDGGFIDYPDPSVDAVNAESKRIKEAMESEYFKNSGIQNRPERSNPNTKYYYMWRSLTAKTPCVLIECGVGQDPHDKIILTDTDRVCNAIARGICKAFNVSFDAPAPTIPPTPTPTPTPAPEPPAIPPAQDYKKILQDIKGVAYGHGWPWTKVNKIKEVLTKAGI